MSVIGTYNGANIIALPSCPAFREIELGKTDAVAMVRSPFTGSQQVQVFPGGDFWDATITLPQMTAAEITTWNAFLGECRGIANTFYLYDPLHRTPAGLAHGTPVVNGVNTAMSTTLNTRGWRVGTYRLLLPGDYLQIGQRLHVVLEQVNSDGNGDAAINIWPSIREATTDGEPVILNNPVGLFRLAENRRSISANQTRLSAVTLKCMEAR
jgi:hypothetical protein